MKSVIKRAGLALARWAPISIVPLDGLLRLSQRGMSVAAGLVRFRDWALQARGRPQFYKHYINLGRWAEDPTQWSFTARGVYARENMTRGCKVLDLCCGDGTYSYLFFSDVAGAIDAVDRDAYALEYARRYCSAPVITYHRIDITTDPLPSSGYDVVVWNAAICYFEEDDIRRILERVIEAAKPTMLLNGMLPRANGWIDHKTEFSDARSVDNFLRQFFRTVAVKELDEGSDVTFYFQASAPLHADRISSAFQ
jgi:SAM-dependent methyltransferase